MAINNPQLYLSTDSGAPVISGTVGAIIAALDAILVGTAGIAYGSKPAAGWTKEYSGTNLAVYRNDPVYGTGCYLRVDDTNAFDAKIQVFSSMSDVNTGSNATSTFYINKSQTSGSTARPYAFTADNLTAYFNVFSNSTSITAIESSFSNTHYSVGGFGDYSPYGANIGCNYFCTGSTDTYANQGYNPLGRIEMPTIQYTIDTLGISAYRSVASTPTLTRCGANFPGALTNGVTYPNLGQVCGRGGVSSLADPDQTTGLSLYAPIQLVGGGVFLGRMRGILAPLNNKGALSSLIAVSAPNGEAGSSGYLIPIHINGGNPAAYGSIYYETEAVWL